MGSGILHPGGEAVAEDSYSSIIGSVAVKRWSVSIDDTLARRVEEHVGERGLSSFVARAVDHELERDTLAAYLGALDEEFGPVPDVLVDEFDALWP